MLYIILYRNSHSHVHVHDHNTMVWHHKHGILLYVYVSLTCLDRNSPSSSEGTPKVDHSREDKVHKLVTSSSEVNLLLQQTNILAARTPALPGLICRWR